MISPPIWCSPTDAEQGQALVDQVLAIIAEFGSDGDDGCHEDDRETVAGALPYLGYMLAAGRAVTDESLLEALKGDRRYGTRVRLERALERLYFRIKEPTLLCGPRTEEYVTESVLVSYMSEDKREMLRLASVASWIIVIVLILLALTGLPLSVGAAFLCLLLPAALSILYGMSAPQYQRVGHYRKISLEKQEKALTAARARQVRATALIQSGKVAPMVPDHFTIPTGVTVLGNPAADPRVQISFEVRCTRMTAAGPESTTGMVEVSACVEPELDDDTVARNISRAITPALDKVIAQISRDLAIGTGMVRKDDRFAY